MDTLALLTEMMLFMSWANQSCHGQTSRLSCPAFEFVLHLWGAQWKQHAQLLECIDLISKTTSEHTHLSSTSRSPLALPLTKQARFRLPTLKTHCWPYLPPTINPSHLSFISKCIKHTVHNHCLEFLSSSSILGSLNSNFCLLRSNETALVKLSDLFLAKVQTQHAILILLDLSAAFDTIAYALLEVLSFLGFSDSVLTWLSSYLSNCPFSMSLRGSSLSTNQLSVRAAKGSGLDLGLFPVHLISG